MDKACDTYEESSDLSPKKVAFDLPVYENPQQRLIDKKLDEFLQDAEENSGSSFAETDSDDDDMGHIIRSKQMKTVG